MNTYVMGEIATLLAVTAIAGILIGWCIKSLLSGRTERTVRATVARDVDEAAADVEQMRIHLQRKDADLQNATLELQQLRGRDVSLSAGNSTQVEEINNLKQELSQNRQTLDRNRAEFAGFRNEKQQELQTLSNQLASFKTGGSVHDERMNEAHDSIAALRAAARENDAIIESLRARIKEADTTVENLRSQLRQAEASQRDALASRQQSEKTTVTINAELQQLKGNLEKQKRDYDTMLETKNREIGKQMSRLEELGSVQSLLQKKEHEFDKLNAEILETARSTGSEINELKQKIENSEKALSDSRSGIQKLQDQVAALTQENKAQIDQHQIQIDKITQTHTAALSQLQETIASNKRELESVHSLKTQVENKSAEVVALNDMLRDISGKRDQSVEKISQLQSKVTKAAAQEQTLAKNEQQMAALASALKQREADYAKLRGELDTAETNRANLSTQVKELQGLSAKLETAKSEIEILRPQKRAAEEAQSQVTKLNALIGERELEIKKLQSTEMDTAEQERQITNLRNSLKQKDAAIQKLRGTGDNLSALNSEVATLGIKINQRDTDLTDAQLRVKNLTASLKVRDQEIQALRLGKEEQAKAQLELDNLTSKFSQQDAEFNKLRTQITTVTNEKNQLLTELQSQKKEQAAASAKLQSTDAERKTAYARLQTEFSQISSARDGFEKRVKDLQLQLADQQKQFEVQVKEAQRKTSELEPQIGQLQSQLATLRNEKQTLTAELSAAEVNKLKVTEREADISKLQMELQEASNNDELQGALKDHIRKVDNLTAAMRDRDNEISRLNQIITDNRVGNKQHTSEVALLKEEIGAQGNLIRSLEEQAENTLQLHTKIATQSTEIESLRADLHATRNQVQQSTSIADQSHEIAQLRQQVSQTPQLQSELTRLQAALAQRDSELSKIPTTQTLRTTRTDRTSSEAKPDRVVVRTTVTPQVTAKPNAAADKPRVFVRHGDTQEAATEAAVQATTKRETTTASTKQVPTATQRTTTATASKTTTTYATATAQRATKTVASPATTAATNSAKAALPAAATTSTTSSVTTSVESLTGTQMPVAQSNSSPGVAATPPLVRRALYTGDGYRLKRADGLDDLALLPGVNDSLANTLRKNDVKDFEQIVLWSHREIAHFADRLGLSAARAEALQWPTAAKEILAGRFRVEASRETERN